MLNLGLESEVLEFKKSTSELNEGIISIVAMLNKSGKGTLYFGVKNNGDAVGQPYSENTLRDISRKIYEDVRPAIYPSISVLEDTPGVIKVEVSGMDRPYSAKGKFYIRSFDEDKQMDYLSIIEFALNNDKTNSLREKEESNETLDVVDEDLLKQYISRANDAKRINETYTNKEEVLEKLGLITNKKLNNAGKFLFSKNKPTVLKVAIFATDEKLSFIDLNRYEGNIFELIKLAQDFIKTHINYSAEIVETKRVETPEIPLEAIREAVLNSFCHSSYDKGIENQIYITPSRVVIFNPGNFPSNYEPEDFAYNGVSSVLRNPLISKVLYYSNDIDSRATGFRRIYSTCKKANVKTSYEKSDQGFSFIFYRKNFNYLPLEQQVLSYIVDKKGITISELSSLTNKSERTIQSVIKKLRDDSKISRVGSKKDGYWIVL